MTEPAHQDAAAPRTSSRSWPRLSLGRRFWLGVCTGVLLLFAGRLVINETRLADYFVRPLLIADTDGPADAIVVLGAAVTQHCTPNLSGIRRSILAARLYREGRAPVLLFSGGTSDASCAVADSMADFALQLGVPAGHVIRETTSRTTWENAIYSDPILRARGATRILLVTDRLHMPRSVACFTELGYQVELASVPIPESHPDNVSMFYWGLREYAANLYYRLFVFKGRGGE